jgi:GT2 family glycosyltransferase
MPLVAVVIPVRDRAAMIADAIASVAAQTVRDHALVVVDDGSRDESAAVAVDALATAGLPGRVLRRPRCGVAAARNAGAAAIDSRWIAFLDSDDLWLPRKLERQMAWLAARPAYRVAQTEERWLDRGRHRNPRAWHRKEERLFPRGLERCLVSPSAVVIARELWDESGGFDPSFPVCEDYELWLRLGLREPVGLVPETLVVKRGGHADQLSRSTWGLDRFRVAALAKLLATAALTPGERRAVQAVVRAKCGVLAAGAARRGRCEEAARYVALCAALDAVVAAAGDAAAATAGDCDAAAGEVAATTAGDRDGAAGAADGGRESVDATRLSAAGDPAGSGAASPS